MLVRPEQCLNALYSIHVTLLPNTISLIEDIPLNQLPIVSQSNSSFSIAEQPSNAPLPMLVTLLGIVMLVRPEQSLNA